MTTYKGVNGTLTTESDAVVFTREGLAARNAFGKDAPPQRVPLAEVTGVVYKPAGKVANGHLRLARNGQPPSTLPVNKDPDGIVFLPQKAAEFDPVAQWLDGVAKKNQDTSAVTSPVAAPMPGSTATRSMTTEPPAPAPQTAPISVPVGQSAQADGKAGQPWYKKRWVPIAAAALVGLLIGSAAGGGGEETGGSSNEAALTAANERAETAEQKLTEAEAALVEAQAAPPAAAPAPAPTAEPAPAPAPAPEVPTSDQLSDGSFEVDSISIEDDGLGDFGGTLRVRNTTDSPKSGIFTVTILSTSGDVLGSAQGSGDAIEGDTVQTVQLISLDDYVEGPYELEFQVDAEF